jgi:mono/diheme cytochrome c family protein
MTDQMKYAAWISILAMAFAVTACGDDETGAVQDVSDVLALTGDATAGSAVYSGAGTCGTVSCHGSTGDDGTSGSELSTVVPALSPESMALTVRYGKGTMAALPSLSAQQIADVIAYVQQEHP